MRTTSSFKLVGTLVLPMNLFPLVGAGKMPAVSRACALGLNSVVGILLPVKGCNTAVCPFLSSQAPLVASGALRVWPALAYCAAVAGETWFEQGVCRSVGSSEEANCPP